MGTAVALSCMERCWRRPCSPLGSTARTVAWLRKERYHLSFLLPSFFSVSSQSSLLIANCYHESASHAARADNAPCTPRRGGCNSLKAGLLISPTAAADENKNANAGRFIMLSNLSPSLPARQGSCWRHWGGCGTMRGDLQAGPWCSHLRAGRCPMRG